MCTTPYIYNKFTAEMNLLKVYGPIFHIEKSCFSQRKCETSWQNHVELDGDQKDFLAYNES